MLWLLYLHGIWAYAGKRDQTQLLYMVTVYLIKLIKLHPLLYVGIKVLYVQLTILRKGGIYQHSSDRNWRLFAVCTKLGMDISWSDTTFNDWR